MDPMRGVTTARRGASPPKQGAAAPSDSPEQLLDAFKAAALSVTKLYKISAATEAKARSDGYQDCLEDLLGFLDKDGIGLDDGEGSKIRRWARDRLDGRESVPQESEDEADRPDTLSSPELVRVSSTVPLQAMRTEDPVKRDASSPAPSPAIAIPEEIPIFIPPAIDAFTFQSSHPYPQLENLDLSDTRSLDGVPASHSTSNHNSVTHATATTPSSRQSKIRGSRTGSRSSHLGRGAGQKRKLNFAEIFDLGSLGYGKDPFGPGSKRNRHI